MSHAGPVLIFLVAPTEVPAGISSWQAAADLIAAHWERRRQGHDMDFVASVSRNWWHQHLLGLICASFGIEGLEFTAREISCLGHDEIRAADEGIERLFQLVAAGNLLEKPELFGGTYADILMDEYPAAFEQAQAASTIDAYDAGFAAAVSFFAFLKSLQAVVRQALQRERSLLYVMPDFSAAGF